MEKSNLGFVFAAVLSRRGEPQGDIASAQTL